ncbi:MAG: hypothetical protein AABW48_01650 [Nanoarchaeota archaeon]
MKIPPEMEADFKTIRDFVDAYRRKYNIAPSSTPVPEFSDYACGEGVNLLYRRIILGPNDWEAELVDDPQSLQAVINQIEKDRKGYGL